MLLVRYGHEASGALRGSFRCETKAELISGTASDDVACAYAFLVEVKSAMHSPISFTSIDIKVANFHRSCGFELQAKYIQPIFNAGDFFESSFLSHGGTNQLPSQASRRCQSRML